MKTKKIWAYDTAVAIAAAKTAKYGTEFEVVKLTGGGYAVVEVEFDGVGIA